MENYPPCNNPDCQKCGNRGFANNEPAVNNYPAQNYYPNENPNLNRHPIPPVRGYPPCRPGPQSGPLAPCGPNNLPPPPAPCAPNCHPNLPPGPPPCRIEHVDDFDNEFGNECPIDNRYPEENRYIGDENFIDDEITDEYLLNYLLRKYKIDKQKLIMMLKRSRESDYKYFVMKKFYKENRNVRKMQYHEQYKIFKQWNNSGVYISKEELENYYENHIRNKN